MLKNNMICSMLVALSLITYSNISSASPGKSDFIVRLVNSSTQYQPLHYTVTSEGQAPIEGSLAVGDDQGKTIIINGKSSEESKAEVLLTDTAGHVIWDCNVTYFAASGSEIYTNAVSLDSHYHVGINAFPVIHSIIFDVNNKS